MAGYESSCKGNKRVCVNTHKGRCVVFIVYYPWFSDLNLLRNSNQAAVNQINSIIAGWADNPLCRNTY
jgi:hypothetical protein